MSGEGAEARSWGLGTLGVHGAGGERAPGRPVVPPIVQSATFFHDPGGDPGEVLYTRYGNNPAVAALGEKLAAMEGTEAALVLGSGMAALALTLLSLAKAGDHVVASRCLYGATQRLLREELPLRGIRTTFVDPASGREWRRALRRNTRVLLAEIPTNPGLRVVDPRPLARLARQRGIALVVDATFATPVNFRPVEFGVDVVVHSATKYLGGHSDLVAGVVCGGRELVEEVRAKLKLYGPAVDPYAAWLLDRGLRTLQLRVERQSENARVLAGWFRGRREVEEVVYPGLPHHPDHRVAREVFRAPGAILGIVVKGGGAAADRFCGALELACVASSLGGVETLVSQPRHTSHRGLTPQERAAQGFPDGFVRISVGVEDVDDLIRDFRRALEAAVSGA